MAVHEAGHAVASVLWGRQVEYVTIAPRGELLSECNNGELLFDLEDSQEVNGQRLFREGVILSAGLAAENLILGIEPEASRALEDLNAADWRAVVQHFGALIRAAKARKGGAA